MSPCAGGNAWGIWERRREAHTHITHYPCWWHLKKNSQSSKFTAVSSAWRSRWNYSHLLYGYPIHEETPETMNERVHLENYIQIFMSFNSLFFLWHKRCWAEFSMKSNWMETIIRCNKSCKTLVNNFNLVSPSIRDILQFQKTWYI